MKFRKLGIIEPIAKAIAEHKIEEPSEIQEKSIPLVLEGKDVIAGSATGSGKTLAFASGIIQNCEKGKGIQALILTPTRELCVQITKKDWRYDFIIKMGPHEDGSYISAGIVHTMDPMF